MACNNYCSEDVGTHAQIDCAEYIPGGQSAIIIVLCGYSIADPSDEEEVQNLIGEGGAKLIEGVTFDIPRASDQTVTNPVACGEDLKVNAQRTANLFDANVSPENDAFYSAINGKNVAQIIAFDCESDYVTFISPAGPISASIEPVVPAGNTEFQRYEGVFTWRSRSFPTKHDKPPGIVS